MTQANGTVKKELIVGPHRVLPGRLSVSRTFGDPEAKIPKFKGNPEVVIARPEIKSFKITNEHDFILMGCDGIFDKLSNKDVVNCVWNTVEQQAAQNIHQLSGFAIETVLKNSLVRRSLDNVTVLMISFANFKRIVFGDDPTTLDSARVGVGVEKGKEPTTTIQQGNSGAPIIPIIPITTSLNYMSNPKGGNKDKENIGSEISQHTYKKSKQMNTNTPREIVNNKQTQEDILSHSPLGCSDNHNPSTVTYSNFQTKASKFLESTEEESQNHVSGASSQNKGRRLLQPTQSHNRYTKQQYVGNGMQIPRYSDVVGAYRHPQTVKHSTAKHFQFGSATLHMQ